MILFAAAFAPELDSLQIPEPQRDTFETLTCGVGGIYASLTLQERILKQNKNPVEEVIFIGSCGSYKRKSEDMQIAMSHHFTNVEYASIQKLSKIPDLYSYAITTEQGSFSKYLSSHITTVNGITNSTGSISLIEWPADCIADFENMEAFFLAACCNRHKIPFSSFMPVTNTVCKQGSEQWLKNFIIYSSLFNKEISSLITDWK